MAKKIQHNPSLENTQVEKTPIALNLIVMTIDGKVSHSIHNSFQSINETINEFNLIGERIFCYTVSAAPNQLEK